VCRGLAPPSKCALPGARIKKATPEGVAFDNQLFKLLLFSLILLQINFKLFFLNIDILFNKVINVDIMLNKSFQIG